MLQSEPTLRAGQIDRYDGPRSVPIAVDDDGNQVLQALRDSGALHDLALPLQ